MTDEDKRIFEQYNLKGYTNPTEPQEPMYSIGNVADRELVVFPVKTTTETGSDNQD